MEAVGRKRTQTQTVGMFNGYLIPRESDHANASLEGRERKSNRMLEGFLKNQSQFA